MWLKTLLPGGAVRTGCYTTPTHSVPLTSVPYRILGPLSPRRMSWACLNTNLSRLGHSVLPLYRHRKGHTNATNWFRVLE